MSQFPDVSNYSDAPSPTMYTTSTKQTNSSDKIDLQGNYSIQDPSSFTLDSLNNTLDNMNNVAAAAAHTSKRLLDTWFKGFVPGQPLSQENLKFWFAASKEVDDMLREQFEKDAERALVDREFREHMKMTGEGTLALTVLLDQIPRNIFRGSPRPFVEFDPLARETVQEALAKKTCRDIHPVYRHILFMPLEHSESVEDQVLCVREFTKEYEEVEPLYKDMFKSFLDYAKGHEEVIKKFGRFPHRNAVLGRIPTEAENIHMESGGARW